MTQIGHRAFADCKNLLSITIPPSLKEIGTKVFDGCIHLDTLEWNAVDTYFHGPDENDAAAILDGCCGSG